MDREYEFEVEIVVRRTVVVCSEHPVFAESTARRVLLNTAENIKAAFPELEVSPSKVLPLQPYSTTQFLPK